MSWFNRLFKRSFNLTEHQRSQIVQFFGSFRANKFAYEDTAYLNEGYEKNIDVFSIIKKIKDTASTIPWLVEQQQRTGQWIALEDTPIHELIDNPNPTKGYTWEDVNEMWDIYYLATGNGYLTVLRPEGMANAIGEIDVLPSHLTCIESDGDYFSPSYSYYFKLDGRRYNFSREDIGHLKYFNPAYQSLTESAYGLSPIQVAAAAVQTGNDRWDASATLFQNKGAIGMITDKSNRPMNAEESSRVQNHFDEVTAGTQNFGRIKVTNKDLNFIAMAMSAQDLQMIEQGVVTTRSLCNVYGVDSSLFNDPANKTYNNRKEAEKALFTNAIMPLLKKKKAIYKQLIVDALMPNQNIRFRPDYTSVEALAEDFHEKAKTYSLLKTSGIITANQAAIELDLEPSEDDNADKLIVTNSNILLETLGGKPQEVNKQLETLRGLSPLTANKLIETLGINEVRGLLGLPELTEEELQALRPNEEETGNRI